MANKRKNDTAYVKQLIVSACQKYGVNPYLALGLARQESGFGQYDNKGNIKRSPKGALGVFQLMPATAKGLKVDPTNLEQNIDGGVRYLAQQLKTFGGDIDKTLAAYNAGPNAVRKYNGIPPYKETQNYVKAIKGNMNMMQHQKDTRNLIASNYAINNNSDTVTGAASNMQQQPNIKLPDTSPYITAEDLKKAQEEFVKDPQAQIFAKRAGAYDSPSILQAQQILASYYNGGIDYESTIQALANLGVPVEQLQTIPKLDPTKRMTDALDVYNQYTGTTPEQQQAMQAQQFEALQKLQGGMNGGQNMYQLMNQYYDQARQAAQMPTGYQIDPEAVQRDINARNWRAGFTGNWDQVSTPEQDAERLYKAQIASQQGMTYDNYLKQKQLELALAQKQIEDALAVQQQYGTVDAKTLDAYNKVIGAQQEIAKSRGEDVRNIITTGQTGQNDITKQTLTNQGNQMTTGQTAAANLYNTYGSMISSMYDNLTDLQKANMALQMGITVQELENQMGIYRANTEADTARYNTDVSRQNKIDEIKSQEDVNKAKGYQAVQSGRYFGSIADTTGGQNPFTLPSGTRGLIYNLNLTPEQINTIQGNNPQGGKPNILQQGLNMFARPNVNLGGQ